MSTGLWAGNTPPHRMMLEVLVEPRRVRHLRRHARWLRRNLAGLPVSPEKRPGPPFKRHPRWR